MNKTSYIFPFVLIAVILTANLIFGDRIPSSNASIADYSGGAPINLPTSEETAIIAISPLNDKIRQIPNNSITVKQSSNENAAIIMKDSVLFSPSVVLAADSFTGAGDTENYFIKPTDGWNWEKLHNYNAVDIANVCGADVRAAAEGLIVESADNGWNSGYGAYVKIEHPNASETVYAHLEKITVSEGNYVKQGDLIGSIGNSGNTHGPTGCHLHFEVRGAKNPMIKQ